jgi:hypothetical protein
MKKINKKNSLNTYRTMYIPLGMCRSVEKNNNVPSLHPVRDASLAGCKGGGVTAFFTERCIPNGILKEEENK